MPPGITREPELAPPKQTAIAVPAGSWRKLLIPSFSDVLFGAVLFWLFATGAGWQVLLGDGDTGFHIRTGDYVLATGHVPVTDLFSFSKAGQPWYAWEWLSGAIFAVLHQLWHLKGVVFFCGVLISASVAALFRYMIFLGAEVMPALFLTFIASGAASIHYLARPHVFTFLFLVIAFYLLESDRRAPNWRIWLLAPLTALWANLHGGFAAVFAILGLTGIGLLLEGLTESNFAWGAMVKPGLGPGSDKFVRFWRLFRVGAVSLVATLANPYGYQLHTHILKFLSTTWWRKHIQEFQPPTFSDEEAMQFEILLVLGLMMAAVLIYRRNFVSALLVLFWAHQALSSVRHVTIYVWVAAPIIAAELTRLWQSFSTTQSARSIAGILRDLSRDLSAKPLYTSVWGAVLVAYLAVAPGQVWPKDFPDVKFPIGMLDRHAAKLVPASGPQPKLLTTDEWGDYLIYKYYPRVRVFVDGRGDFYGEKHGTDFLSMMKTDHRWRQLLDKWDFDYALIPHEWGLSEVLKIDGRWRLVEDSSLGVLFERRRP